MEYIPPGVKAQWILAQIFYTFATFGYADGMSQPLRIGLMFNYHLASGASNTSPRPGLTTSRPGAVFLASLISSTYPSAVFRMAASGQRPLAELV